MLITRLALPEDPWVKHQGALFGRHLVTGWAITPLPVLAPSRSARSKRAFRLLLPLSPSYATTLTWEASLLKPR